MDFFFFKVEVGNYRVTGEGYTLVFRKVSEELAFKILWIGREKLSVGSGKLNLLREPSQTRELTGFRK